MCVKFQKDRPENVRGVAGKRYILPIHFCSIRAWKKSKLKMKKNVIKNNFRILKKQYAYLQMFLKVPVKFEKDWPKTVGGVVGRRMVGALTDGRMYGGTDGGTDTQNFRGYNIIPRHFLVVGHKKYLTNYK